MIKIQNPKNEFGKSEFRISLVVAIFFLLFTLSTPYIVLAVAAQPQGLIPCGNTKDADGKIIDPCGPCDIFVLGQNILNFILMISIPIATLALIYGGFLMVVPTSSADKLTKGKKVLTNTFIGIAIVFFAWLGIDTIIKVLAGHDLLSGSPAHIQGYGPWNRIECPITRPSSSASGGGGTRTAANNPVSTGGVQSRVCSGCANLSVPMGPNTCLNQARGQICQISQTMNDKPSSLNQRIINDGKLNYWRVTEAWPPTITHQNSCHPNGTCVDANFIGSARSNPQEIKYFIQQNQNVGLRAVYEVTNEGRKQELVNSGVPVSNIQVVGPITGEHFSIYLPSQSSLTRYEFFYS